MRENDFDILIHCTNTCVCEWVYVGIGKQQFYPTSCINISCNAKYFNEK